jgi:hypothetical protein
MRQVQGQSQQRLKFPQSTVLREQHRVALRCDGTFGWVHGLIFWLDFHEAGEFRATADLYDDAAHKFSPWTRLGFCGSGWRVECNGAEGGARRHSSRVFSTVVVLQVALWLPHQGNKNGAPARGLFSRSGVQNCWRELRFPSQQQLENGNSIQGRNFFDGVFWLFKFRLLRCMPPPDRVQFERVPRDPL